MPFDTGSFNIALSSHFLFLYSEQLTYEFHEESIGEMLRVADEVRIFPIVDLNCEKSPYVDKLMKKFQEEGHRATIEETGYEFQSGANKLLRIVKGT